MHNWLRWDAVLNHLILKTYMPIIMNHTYVYTYGWYIRTIDYENHTYVYTYDGIYSLSIMIYIFFLIMHYEL